MSEGAVIDTEAPAEVITPGAETPAPQPAPPGDGEQVPADKVTPPPASAPEKSPEEQARSRLQRQRDAANRKLGAEKARADFLAAEVERLRPKPQPTEAEPKLENFTDVGEYAKAVREQAVKDYQQRQQQETQQQTVARLSESWQTKAAEAEEKYEDFHEIVGEIRPVNPLSAGIIEAGPDVAYYLGKNLAEARKIASMSNPIQQFVALGKIAAKLESAPTVAKVPSKAPPPINPVGGKTAAPAVGLESDDMKEFIRARNIQMGRRKAG